MPTWQGRYKDPVCHMAVNPQEAAASVDYRGERYFFCAEACKQKFLADPIKYLKPRGWRDRFLQKHIRANERGLEVDCPACRGKRD